MLTLKNVIFLTKAHFPILKPPLDSWHQSKFESGLRSWFWVLVGPSLKTRQILTRIFIVCLRKCDFFINDTKHRQIIYCFKFLRETNPYIPISSFENDRWQIYSHLNLRPKWVSHFGQKSGERPTMEAGIGTKATVGRFWGCLCTGEGSTAGQPRGGSHHGFIFHPRRLLRFGGAWAGGWPRTESSSNPWSLLLRVLLVMAPVAFCKLKPWERERDIMGRRKKKKKKKKRKEKRKKK